MGKLNLENLVEAFRSAEATANGFTGNLEGSSEAANLDAAIKAIAKTKAKAQTFDGAIEALRLAIEENDNFATPEMLGPLMKGCLGYFEAVEDESCTTGREAMVMAEELGLSNVNTLGMVAIYDALSSCIETLDGIINQPRCGDDGRPAAAGCYVYAVSNFLTSQRRRAMEVLAARPLPAGEDPEARNFMILQWIAKDGDTSFADIAAMALKMEDEQQAYKATKKGTRT